MSSRMATVFQSRPRWSSEAASFLYAEFEEHGVLAGGLSVADEVAHLDGIPRRSDGRYGVLGVGWGVHCRDLSMLLT